MWNTAFRKDRPGEPGKLGKPGKINPADISLERLRRNAEFAVRALPPLTMPAELHALSLSHGIHGRRKSGPGDAFWQYRPYMTGDPASLIDWRRSARSDSRYVRQNEWETAQNVWLWCDVSASMQYRSAGAGDSKIERAMTLAIAASMMLVAGGERIGYAGAMSRTADGRFAVSRVVEALDLARFAEDTAMPDHRKLGKRAHLIAIGDFLSDPDEVIRQIQDLAANGVSGHIIHILDPAEADFPFTGRTRFEGLEGDGEEIVPRAEDARSTYLRSMSAWQGALSDITRRCGWSYTMHRTDHAAHLVLVGLLGAIEAAIS